MNQMKLKIAFVYAVALAGLSACGHKDDQPVVQSAVATTPDTSAYIGGACGQQVALDYDRLNDQCRRPNDRREGQLCRSSAEDFLRKYPAVSCTLSERDGFRGEVHERRIEAREIQDLIERLRRSGF